MVVLFKQGPGLFTLPASGFGVALVRQRLGAAWFDGGRLLEQNHHIP